MRMREEETNKNVKLQVFSLTGLQGPICDNKYVCYCVLSFSDNDNKLVQPNDCKNKKQIFLALDIFSIQK